MTRRRRLILLGTSLILLLSSVAIVSFAFGCFAGQRKPTRLPALADAAPRLVHVVGWNGPVACDRDFLHALRDGGCDHAMETFDWTDGHNGLAALWYAQRSDLPAGRLAVRLEQLAREAPHRPIDVTADSSGCGVALAALEQLPADVRVRTVVLSSPAVSSGYDVAPALARVEGRMVAFRSDRDWFILGFGTWLFGTVDRRHASGAGRYGFTRTPDERAGAKLVQVDYDPRWSEQFDHTGGHAASLRPAFARGYVAPLLLGRR